MLISRGCPWVSMKRGGCKFGGSKTGAVHGQKGGAVVSQLVLKLKESVPPPPGVAGVYLVCKKVPTPCRTTGVNCTCAVGQQRS